MIDNKNEKSNNVNSIEYKVNKTIENFHETEEMIENTNDEAEKSSLEAKNDRRIETLNNMKKEVIEEAMSNQKD